MEKINKFLLFLLPVIFAIPNLAINLSIINLRVDDLIVYILLIIHLKRIPSFKYHFFVKTQFFILFFAILSLFFALILTYHRVSGYEVTRALGSIPHLILLPILFSEKEYRNIIYKGAIVGGIIYLGSIIYNYNTILSEAQDLARSSSFKFEMGFSTLNPNAVASISLIIGYLNVLGYFETKNKFHLFNFLLLLVPFFVLARAASVGTLVAISFLVLLSKYSIKKYMFYAGGLFIGWIIITFFISEELLVSATTVDIKTGEGLSKRDVLWRQGMQLVEESPLFGFGFCTENGVFKDKFDGHMAHQILLHYAIELGIIVLLIFIISVIFLLRERIRKYYSTYNIVYLIQFCFFLGFFIADMTGQLLYFNKYAYIIYILTLFVPNKIKNE